MPVTVTLSTMPGSITREDRGTSTTIEMFGKSFGTEVLPGICSVADIKASVATFGAKIRAKQTSASFYVSVTLAKKCRKPNGYDDATRTNGFGQDDFMHVTDKRTKPAPPEAIRILNLRLPAGYAADRYLDHIAISLQGRQIGCLAHDIAPLDLEAQVNSHHGAGGLGDLPRIGFVAAPDMRALTGAGA